ncbi:MAG: PASTA domain-containing protein [Acidimicrobiales bacterium]
MPPSTALPPSLIRLSRTQALELSDERWEYDTRRLVARLDEIVTSRRAAPITEPVPPPAPPAVRPSADPARPRRRWTRWMAVGVVASLLVLAAAVGLARQKDDAAEPSRVVAVVGMSIDAATGALQAAGFRVQPDDTVDDDHPAGTVLRQDPAAGATGALGATVTLGVARPSGSAVVPRVVGLNRTEAENALRSAGLEPAFEDEDSDAPPDQVLSQSPDHPARVDKAARVTVKVAKARAPAAAAGPVVSSGPHRLFSDAVVAPGPAAPTIPPPTTPPATPQPTTPQPVAPTAPAPTGPAVAEPGSVMSGTATATPSPTTLP